MVGEHEGGAFFCLLSFFSLSSTDENASQTLVLDEGKNLGQAGVDYYFLEADGGMFKATITYEPYFYLATRVHFPLCFPFELLLTFLSYRPVMRGKWRSG
jgi:hypothetical protein